MYIKEKRLYKLVKRISKLLDERGLKLCTIESCTGGLIAKLITDVPGVSSFFVGSVIAYSNNAKINIVGVNKKTIDKYGAVSSECVEEMAIKGAKLFDSDICISVSGIAGPGGGSIAKPVGRVYIGLYSSGRISSFKFDFGNIGREQVRLLTAKSAFRILLKAIETINDQNN